MSAKTLSLVKADLDRINRRELRKDTVLLRFDDAVERSSIVAWYVSSRPSSDRVAVVGVVADAALVTDVLARIVKEASLLPPSLAGDSRDLLSIRVSTTDGREVFASSTIWSPYTSETTLEHQFGDLRVHASLTASAADRLIIGGLPRTRVPLLIGLLAMTAALIGVALVQLRRERELGRLRADFISGVSHELRTPLAQIRMFGETLLLNRVRSSDERRRSLEIIVQESQRLTQLIENVLQFARVDRGAAVVTPTVERLDVLLNDIVDGFEPLAKSKRTSITRRIDDDIVAPVDAGALRQIVLNLLDNALKYGPAGQTVVVTCRCEGDTAVIGIEDQGPGVSDDEASRIWDPFYRIAHEGRAAGGTGIGLAIVKRLVDMHAGRVRVERGAEGARFVVELLGARRERPEDAIRAASAGA